MSPATTTATQCTPADSPIARATLGRSGLSVSRLGLAGSFGIDAKGTERAFHELGINYFFLTPRMKAAAEGVRNLVRAGYRDRLVLQTGVTLPFGWSVERSFKKCAKALGVEHIDVFQLFWVQANWYVTGKTWATMRTLKERGDVGALAVSCHDRPMARRLADELELDALMIRYNAAHRGAEREIFATLGASAAERPGIIGYTATRWGRLLKPAGGEPALSGPDCYRFALGHPNVDAVLCGASDYDELAQNVAGVARGPLLPEQYDAAKRLGDAVRASATGRLGFLGR